jgi:hypothetical protein
MTITLEMFMQHLWWKRGSPARAGAELPGRRTGNFPCRKWRRRELNIGKAALFSLDQ